MATDRNKQGNSDADFSFGTKELRQARAAQNLTLAAAPKKSNSSNVGFDPYNTSGSFDRKKHWERVGKR